MWGRGSISLAQSRQEGSWVLPQKTLVLRKGLMDLPQKTQRVSFAIGMLLSYCSPMKKAAPVKMVSRSQLKLRQAMYQSEGSAVSAFSTRKQMLR